MSLVGTPEVLLDRASITSSAQAEEQQQLAQLFTHTVAVAIELVDQSDQRGRALESRGVIEQAEGMLMPGRHCDGDQAFDILRRMSHETTSDSSTSPAHCWPYQDLRDARPQYHVSALNDLPPHQAKKATPA